MFTQEEWKIIFSNWLKSKNAYASFVRRASLYNDVNSYLLSQSHQRYILHAFGWTDVTQPSPYYWFDLHHEWCRLCNNYEKCLQYLQVNLTQSINIF